MTNASLVAVAICAGAMTFATRTADAANTYLAVEQIKNGTVTHVMTMKYHNASTLTKLRFRWHTNHAGAFKGKCYVSKTPNFMPGDIIGSKVDVIIPQQGTPKNFDVNLNHILYWNYKAQYQGKAPKTIYYIGIQAQDVYGNDLGSMSKPVKLEPVWPQLKPHPMVQWKP